ncbi:hypothetical protein CEW83_02340 [Parazoarcus communis]|uniref:Recombinase family protein n=1 Tax=Parazoarcus communis TaxID=41977 RepID=A0A2U8GKV1_9RHOO|nr:recombinase family protein [Parazoarcus communis]AWI74202.1 hypothetical protein CEW83_02340 [Parazoarcus communis]
MSTSATLLQVAASTLAFYARYSDESQSPTSIDDQLRRCRDIAERHGYPTSNALVFTDEEVSSFRADKAASREGYRKLMDAWEQGRIDILIVDELSRLARNGRQQLELFESIDSTGVRFLTANGIDSALEGWRLVFNIQGMMAQEESRATSFRVIRGMRGQLERGYMIAQPPIGYQSERVLENGRELGTKWSVDEASASLVREMYARRGKGESFGSIAAWLNGCGVPTPRNGRLWRAAGIQRLLENAIYRGEFILNGSSFAKTKARKLRKKTKLTPQAISFDRPLLRIVSDEVWYAAQPRSRSGEGRTQYGGGRNIYSGWMRCGHCGSLLSATSGGSAFSCGGCISNRRAADPAAPAAVPTISKRGIEQVVRHALSYTLSADRLDELRERLKERLSEDPESELKRLRLAREHAKQRAQRVLRLISLDPDSDELAETEYAAAKDALKVAEQALKRAEGSADVLLKRDLVAQLSLTPEDLAGKLLDGELEVAHVRTVLSRLFSHFVLTGREGRVSIFHIEFRPGVAAAWLTDSAVVDESICALEVRISCSAKRPVEWKLEAQRVKPRSPLPSGPGHEVTRSRGQS